MTKKEMNNLIQNNILICIKAEQSTKAPQDYYNFEACEYALRHLQNYLCDYGARSFKEYLTHFNALQYLRETYTPKMFLFTKTQENSTRVVFDTLKKFIFE